MKPFVCFSRRCRHLEYPMIGICVIVSAIGLNAGVAVADEDWTNMPQQGETHMRDERTYGSAEKSHSMDHWWNNKSPAAKAEAKAAKGFVIDHSTASRDTERIHKKLKALADIKQAKIRAEEAAIKAKWDASVATAAHRVKELKMADADTLAAHARLLKLNAEGKEHSTVEEQKEVEQKLHTLSAEQKEEEQKMRNLRAEQTKAEQQLHDLQAEQKVFEKGEMVHARSDTAAAHAKMRKLQAGKKEIEQKLAEAFIEQERKTPVIVSPRTVIDHAKASRDTARIHKTTKALAEKELAKRKAKAAAIEAKWDAALAATARRAKEMKMADADTLAVHSKLHNLRAERKEHGIAKEQEHNVAEEKEEAEQKLHTLSTEQKELEQQMHNLRAEQTKAEQQLRDLQAEQREFDQEEKVHAHTDTAAVHAKLHKLQAERKALEQEEKAHAYKQ